MKKIMIIGSGEFQLPGIIEAKRQGLYVIATDGYKNAIGKDYCDEFYNIDVKDLNANYALAREKEIDGVIAVSSEVSVETVAYVSEKLGLRGNRFETAVLCHNKEKYYRNFTERGISVPSTFVYGTDDIRYIKTDSVVVKPSKGSGSRLVHKVSKFDIENHINKYMSQFSPEESILIQEYVSGMEVTVDGFVHDYGISILAISHERCNPDVSNSVSVELDFPPEWITSDITNSIIETAKMAAIAAGIEFGPFHIEFIIDENKNPFLIDFALRGGGFKLFTDIVPKTGGVNILSEYIRGALGEKILIIQPKEFKPVHLSFLYADKEGILKGIKGLELCGNHNDYILGFLKNVGEYVVKPTSGRDRLAYVITWGQEIQQVKNMAHNIVSAVEFIIE